MGGDQFRELIPTFKRTLAQLTLSAIEIQKEGLGRGKKSGKKGVCRRVERERVCCESESESESECERKIERKIEEKIE